MEPVTFILRKKLGGGQYIDSSYVFVYNKPRKKNTVRIRRVLSRNIAGRLPERGLCAKSPLLLRSLFVILGDFIF
jgi:hypothetical protein